MGAGGGSSSVFDGRYSSSSATAPSTSSDSTVHSPLAVAWMAVPPSSASPTSMPVNSATICGPDTNATASELITTRSDNPKRSAGPDTTGPVAAAITGTRPLQREMAAAACPHPCSEATPSCTSAPLDATKNTNGIPRSRAWSAASASRTPSAWVKAPRRMEASDRQMTTLRPPMRPTTEETAPTIPLPTSAASAVGVVVVTVAECTTRSRSDDRSPSMDPTAPVPVPAPTPAPAPAPVPAAEVAPMSASEVAKLSTERIMELFAESAASMASLAGLICLLGGELERREGFRVDGATSLQSWITAHAGVSAPTARAYSEVGGRLFDLPHLSGALSEGRISFDKVRAVAGVATPETDADLAEAATELSVRDLAELARSARPPGGSDARSEQEARSLRCNDTKRTVSAQLPRAAYVEARNTLEARAKQISSDGQTPWDQRMADAFVSLVRSGARPDSGTGPGSGSRHPTSPYAVVAHVPLETLLDESSELCGELERGGLVSADVVRRLACDATLIIAVDDDVGHTLYEGRQRRLATPTQRREVCRRDRHCRFPGCHNVVFTNTHHIDEWEADFGLTDFDNLALLCEHHHALIHSKAWTMRGDPNVELTFVGPSGRVMTSRPSPLWARVSAAPARRAAAKGAAGTEKDPRPRPVGRWSLRGGRPQPAARGRTGHPPSPTGPDAQSSSFGRMTCTCRRP